MIRTQIAIGIIQRASGGAGFAVSTSEPLVTYTLAIEATLSVLIARARPAV